MKLKLLPKFILSLGAMALVLTITISLFSYANSKTYLETLYAERVMTNSNAIAAMLDVEDVKTILAPGGDQTAAYREMYDLFNRLKRDGNVTYLSLVVPDEDSVCFYIDAMVEEMGDDPANQLPYGSDILYVDAANPDDPADMEKYITIWEHYAENRGVDTPLVTDNDYGYNYTGISVILDENGEAIAEIQYIMDMTRVRTYLTSFLLRILLISFAIICVTIVVYIGFVRASVTKPLGKLADFTQDITASGEFAHRRIEIKTGDEIETLGDSFNFMLAELEDYIANLSRVTAEKERIGAELDVAKHIQASMLPCVFPAFPERRNEFDIHASMTPAKEVGGDFYDFFLVDSDHLAMVMADVSGKGVPAALFMMISKTLLKSAAQSGLSPKEILEKVNDQLCENNDAEMFVTVWLGILEISTGKLRCANAGHEYPVLSRRGERFELFKDKHGFVLAGMEGVRYREYEIELHHGDRLFVYTDGVPEATNAASELYGTERMLASLNGGTAGESCRALLERVHADVDAFTGEADQFDDITMLCLELRGQEEKTLTLSPTIEGIGAATAFFEDLLTEAGAGMKTIAQVNVAVDEIFSNIALYSGASEATLGCTVENGEATLRFSDNGRPYDPTARPDPDTTLPAEEREIGGLGIYMVKKTMDTVRYEYADARNILTLTKKLGGTT